METILRNLLSSHLSSYLSSEDEDEGSGLSFRGVVFRYILSALRSPFSALGAHSLTRCSLVPFFFRCDEYPRVQRFTAQVLEILVPWASLATSSIEVHLKGVNLALGPADDARDENASGDLEAQTQGKPWDEAWREEGGGLADDGVAPAATTNAAVSSWVGMSIRSRLIRSGLNVSLCVEDLTFTEEVRDGSTATVRLGSLRVANIPTDDWVGLVRDPETWLGKAVVIEDLEVSVGGSLLRVGSAHVSSVLPIYEFLDDSFEYSGSDRIVPVCIELN